MQRAERERRIAPGAQRRASGTRGEIARGAMGIVYHAYDEKMGRPASSGRGSCRSRAAVAGLEHPNILPVHDADEHDGILFIA